MKTILIALSAVTVFAQAPAQKTEKPAMSFFLASVGMGDGAKLGGLAGADAHCQKLAGAAGAGSQTWRAYLSVAASDGKPAVNARDRIGAGPWFNAKGAKVGNDLAHLHGDTVELARVGNLITRNNSTNEKGELVNAMGDKPNTHDVLTGSQADGRAYTDAADHTCKNWTGNGEGSAQVGHFDRNGGGVSWNSVHPSRGCSQENLAASGGAGLFYCFAGGK